MIMPFVIWFIHIIHNVFKRMFQFELPDVVSAGWWEDDTGSFKETIGIEDIDDDLNNIVDV